jgi:hypothetical protein
MGKVELQKIELVSESGQSRIPGAYLNLSNQYLAHESEPTDRHVKIRRFNFAPINGTSWESRSSLKRRALGREPEHYRSTRRLIAPATRA